MRLVGRENQLETINKTALRLAREVADETGTLMAGNICNSTIYDASKPELVTEVHDSFKVRFYWNNAGKLSFQPSYESNCKYKEVLALHNITAALLVIYV